LSTAGFSVRPAPSADAGRIVCAALLLAIAVLAGRIMAIW
jgi:hypothetical protein